MQVRVNMPIPIPAWRARRFPLRRPIHHLPDRVRDFADRDRVLLQPDRLRPPLAPSGRQPKEY